MRDINESELNGYTSNTTLCPQCSSTELVSYRTTFNKHWCMCLSCEKTSDKFYLTEEDAWKEFLRKSEEPSNEMYQSNHNTTYYNKRNRP